MTNKIFNLFLSILLLLIVQNLYAEKAYTHDGFFFRLLTSAGKSSIVMQNPNPDVDIDEETTSNFKLKGDKNTIDNSFQVGKAPTENFIVSLNTSFSYLSDRELSIDDPISAQMMEEENINLSQKYSTYAFGMGFTYYIWQNIYLGAEYRSAVFAKMETLSSSKTFEKAELSGSGIGFSIGKEFWVSEELGIGIAFVYKRDILTYENYHYRSDDLSLDEEYQSGNPRDLITGSVDNRFTGLALSITYN